MSRYAKRVSERWHDALSRVGWDDFERRVGDYYAGQGYRVEHSGTGSGIAMTDGGIDLKLYKDGTYIVVQCKHWNALQVPHNPVHELIGVMHTAGANAAILITSGQFTRAAMESASRFPGITLIDGVAIREMIGPIDSVALQSTGLVSVPLVADANPPWVGRARQAKRRDAAMFAVAIVATAATLFIYTQLVRRATLPKRPVVAPITAVPMAPRGHAPTMQAVRDTTPRTPAEIKAWERQNAEAMKILEKTTPALQSP